MKSTLQRRQHRREARERFSCRKKRIQDEHQRQQDAKLEALRRTENAAILIQSVRRAFLAKKRAAHRRFEHSCATNLQRIARGKLAKNVAYQLSLEKRRVVPPGYSLRALLKRSQIIRRDDPWREHRDSVTNAIYYYNSKTLETQWEPPANFLESFVCNWGFCDLEFESLADLTNHRKFDHKWMCPACFERHHVDFFPKCPVCENNLDTDGLVMGQVAPETLTTEELKTQLLARDFDVNLVREGLIDKLTQFVQKEVKDREKIEETLSEEEVEIHKLFELPPIRDIVPLPHFPEFSAIKVREAHRKNIQDGGENDESLEELKRKSIAHEARKERIRQRQRESVLQSQEELAEKRKKLLEVKQPIGYTIPPEIDIEMLYKTKIQNGHGIREYQNGCKYIGNLVNGIFQGQGIFQWPDGSRYEGVWVKNERHGKGKFLGNDGSMYEGDWFKGKRHGLGVYKTSNKEIYEGEWRDGFMQGRGLLQARNGDIYYGRWKRGKYHGLGVFEKANGDKFIGRCAEGKAEGSGILKYADGELYRGEWKDDKRHGRGVCLLKTGNKYTGGWANGRYNGFGVFENVSTSERYDGNWDDGRMTGVGRYQFSNNDVYQGNFKDGVATGYGVYYYKEAGHVYDGEWKNDTKHGRGKFYFASGAFYDGMWKNGKINGYGCFTYKTGDSYSGGWKDNLKHGKGTFVFTNGNQYKGEFRFNKMSGFGEMKYITGHTYKGEWKNNKKHGKGEFSYADGNKYVGEFKEDVKDGFGVLYYRPGTPLEETYHGQFVAGIRHGKGKYVYADGEVYDGKWENGIRHGYGLYTTDEFIYEGNFVRDVYQGKGYAKWLKNGNNGKEGNEYDGMWHRGMLHGRGVLSKANGDVYTGGFVYGKKDGSGVVKYADGNIYKGMWENGIRVGHGKYILHAKKRAKDEQPGLGDEISLAVVGC